MASNTKAIPRKLRPSKKSAKPVTRDGGQRRATNVSASKLDSIVAALRSPRGASIAALMTLTGWQQHSVRGAIAGALKKKRGLKITSSKPDGERIYRIEGGK